MQGISKSKHEHLKYALLKMERLLAGGDQYCDCLQQATDYNLKLETIYRKYEQLLRELSGQIAAYEILYKEVKVQFLGRKLKELKKEIPIQKSPVSTLIENIQLAYST